MKKASTSLLLALTLALFAGCDPSPRTGSARLTVSVPQELTSTVSRVTVVASSADFPSLSLDLTFDSGVWSGTLANIPAGPLRTFRAQAFDSSNTVLFEGSASGITITADQTTLVAILLQEVNPAPPFQNEAPVIDSLVASATSIRLGTSLSLVATARDANPSDTLTYAWLATAGSFSSTSTASTSWTAPTTTGIQTLTLTVTDPGGLSSSASLAIHVIQGEVQGDAQLSITFNRFPTVTALAASPTLLAVGQATTVSATASDLDGDSLSYAWSANCAGTWSTPSASSAQFTPSALPSGACNNCRLTVSVLDGRGGSTTGTVALCVSNAPRINHFKPIIANAYASSETATPGQVLTYEVFANDPEGTALTFAWSANTGTVGTATTSATSSRVTWTAPTCAISGTPTVITATVTNAFNLSATRSFMVTGLPVCPSGWASGASLSSTRSDPAVTVLSNGRVFVVGGYNTSYLLSTEVYNPASGTWSTARSMNVARGEPTATTLSNGKVLVAGGSNTSSTNASAEVYDPTANTWSSAGTMNTQRSSHQAVLLPNGKVLVAGGYNGFSQISSAELYDPATNTWSTTSPMSSARAGHALMLLPNGKVLAVGGSNSSTIFATAELYDPASGTWSAARPMATGRTSVVAVLLANGKVLVSGGYNGSYLASAELYDPASDSWSTTGSMTTPREGHTATVLSSGKVLVVAGRSTTSTYLTAAEVYDPATGTWSAAGALSTAARINHVATRLPNGKVLVTGGYNGSYLGSTELYSP
jgi:N-acetylneuraminic acid mutarotase